MRHNSNHKTPKPKEQCPTCLIEEKIDKILKNFRATKGNKYAPIRR